MHFTHYKFFKVKSLRAHQEFDIHIPVSIRTGSLDLITKAFNGRNPVPRIGRCAGKIEMSDVTW
jgi:hypothetical protein